MDKLKMETKNLTDKNIEKIEALFPNVITEMEDENGKLKKGINFDLLKQELSEDVIDGEECYDFTWVGKKAAIVESNTPIRKTLRPCIEESKNWENTENLYIEGDNLEVLKLLQESYLNSIKMIYIDPPYNTGNDFIYRDNFKIDKEEYEEQIGLYDEDENMMFKNTDTNGRFHSDWCSMMYPRLKLAQNLLSEDGVIFISIDDNEVENIKKICNEIFGESNFVGLISRATGTTTGQDANKIGSSVDYCLAYSKDNTFILKGISLNQKDAKRFNESDSKGNYSILQLRKTGNSDTKQDRPNMFYPVMAPDGTEVYPFGPTNYLSRWRVGKETYQQLISDNLIVWKENEIENKTEIEGYKKSKWTPYVKYYLEGRTKQVSNLFQDIEGNKKGSIALKELFGNKGIFDNPKPVQFIEILIQISSGADDLILDFFSGSSTTAHAVMQLNAEDDGKRKFIMVQLPEKTEENSEAFKAGYENICEIGKERIRRAGEKVKTEIEESNKKLKDGEEPKKVPDIGFRVLKVDNTNMKDVYYAANEITQESITDMISNIKEDRTDMDLLYGVMLDWGLPLSLKHEIRKIEGSTVHIVDENSLVACFENKVSETVIREIAKLQAIRVVFRDSSFEGSPEKINVEEIFKLLSPNTKIRVI